MSVPWLFSFSFFLFLHPRDTFSAKPFPLSCWWAQGFPCFTCTECIDTGASGSAWAGDKTSPRGARKVFRKDHPGKYKTHLLRETHDHDVWREPCLSGLWELVSWWLCLCDLLWVNEESGIWGNLNSSPFCHCESGFSAWWREFLPSPLHRKSR